QPRAGPTDISARGFGLVGAADFLDCSRLYPRRARARGALGRSPLADRAAAPRQQDTAAPAGERGIFGGRADARGRGLHTPRSAGITAIRQGRRVLPGGRISLQRAQLLDHPRAASGLALLPRVPRARTALLGTRNPTGSGAVERSQDAASAAFPVQYAQRDHGAGAPAPGPAGRR